MKKLFSLISTITLITTGITPVISCGTTTYSNVTKQQETQALIKFAKQNNITDINLTTLNFINSEQSHNQQSILWDFTTSKNSTLADHTQLLGQYGGIMLYHNQDKTFTLETKPVNPFAKPARYIPGYYDSSFDISSYIIGKTSDFTIVANADDLKRIVQDVDPAGGVSTMTELFKELQWNNLADFPGLTLKDLNELIDSPPTWQIPENYFAVIHAQKINNQYQIVWSNLATTTDKQIFLNSKLGYINSFFWKQSNSVFHLWSSHEFLLELTQLYQLDKNPDNFWFSTPSLQKLFKQTPASGGLKAGTVYLATVPKSSDTPAGYQAFNAGENQLISAIQSLIKTSGSFQIFSIFVANNYHNNNLTFTYQNNTFTFDPNQSGPLTNT